MPSLYAVTFEVTGRYPFPVDMLRYDEVHPLRSEDAAAITESLAPTERRSLESSSRVRLARFSTHGLWRPTEGRWRSFGWSVDEASVTERRL